MPQRQPPVSTEAPTLYTSSPFHLSLLKVPSQRLLIVPKRLRPQFYLLLKVSYHRLLIVPQRPISPIVMEGIISPSINCAKKIPVSPIVTEDITSPAINGAKEAVSSISLVVTKGILSPTKVPSHLLLKVPKRPPPFSRSRFKPLPTSSRGGPQEERQEKVLLVPGTVHS